MKPSKYNIFFEYRNKQYVYNTLTSAILSLPLTVFNQIKSAKYSTLDRNEVMELKNNGILVDDDVDEISIYEHYYNVYQYNKAVDELRIVVLPTYQCNLRCTYCFEECKDVHSKLNNDIIDDIAKFVENEITTLPNIYKKINVTLFGGEPLICQNECVKLMQRLKYISDANAITLYSKIITNATLIDEYTIKQLILPFHMRLQITLDGSQSVHDQRRKYKSGKGSFDTIKTAILLLNQYNCKELIDLRLNIDKDNIECIEKVFKEFHDLCGYMYIGLLRPAGNNACNSDKCISDNEYLIHIRPKLEPLINRYNKQLNYVSFGKKHPCALNRPNSFIIDPMLNVYKCDNLIGEKKYAIGKIVSGKLQKFPQYYIQTTWSPFKFNKCIECKLLPVCAADCAYRCLMFTGTMQKPHCSMTEKQLIEKVKLYISNND